MATSLFAIASVLLHASPQRAWKALTDPEEIKKYLFGTTTKTDWKVGSPITYSGEWEGKHYEDKGTIIEVRPNEYLHTTYFSFMSGREDKPENYANVMYKLTPAGNDTILTIVQDNSADMKSRDHSESNWQTVLDGLKKVVEQ